MDLLGNTSDALGSLFKRFSSSVTGSAVESAAPPPDPLDQLKKLADLRDSDAISPLEFEEHKAKLLAKLSRDAER